MLENQSKFKPFVCALKHNWKTLRCDHCFKPGTQLIGCNSCCEFWYCTETCRQTDATVHQIECVNKIRQFVRKTYSEQKICDELDWIKFRDPDEYLTHTQLLLRIIFALNCAPNASQQKHGLADFGDVCYDNIVTPECKSMHKVWQTDTDYKLVDEISYNFGAWLSMVRNVLDMPAIVDKIGRVSEQMLNRAFLIVVRYTVYVNDMTFINELGKAIYIELCFIPHSCVPNCVPLFRDDNCLELRLLDSSVTKVSELKYDYQIEMAGYSANDLRDSLNMRNIECNCKLCANTKQYSENLHQKLTRANEKYGNWPFFDYCRYMRQPITELVDNFRVIYGEFHPWITALRLWKFRIEIELIKSCDRQNANAIIDSLPFDVMLSLNRLRESIMVTHGSDHKWLTHLASIESYLKNITEAKQSKTSEKFDFDSTINHIIQRNTFDRKLF